MAPLVGRERELGLLLARWEAARGGGAGRCCCRARPGSASPASPRALVERAKADGAVALGFSCSPYHAATALLPVVDHLERAAGWRSEEPRPGQAGKLEALVAPAAEEPGRVVPLLALAARDPEGEPLSALS